MKLVAHPWSATPSRTTGELVAVDGAPPPGAGVGADVGGVDPDSADDGVGPRRPPGGGVVRYRDLDHPEPVHQLPHREHPGTAGQRGVRRPEPGPAASPVNQAASRLPTAATTA